MVNTVMAAKRAKLNKQIRALPRHGEPVFFTEGKHRDPQPPRDNDQKIYYDTAQYRKRAKGMQQGDIWDKLDPARFKGVPPERLLVLQHIRRIENAVPDMLFFNIVDSPYHLVRVFFNARMDCYILQHTEFNTGVIRTSIGYPSRARCVGAWEADNMTWTEFKKSSG